MDLSTLDMCHGMEMNGKYVYISAPNHYPYTLGCFRGRPAKEVRPVVECNSTEGAPGLLCSSWNPEDVRWLSREEVTVECSTCTGDCEKCQDEDQYPVLSEETG